MLRELGNCASGKDVVEFRGGTYTLQLRNVVIISALAFFSTAGFAQVAPLNPTNAPAIGPAGRQVNPAPYLDAFQVNYLPSAPGGGAPNGTITITNTGGLGNSYYGPFAAATGSICVNLYVFNPDEQETNCCSCLVTPNALVHITASDLSGNPGNGVAPNLGIVVKILATVPGPAPSTPGTNGVGGTPAGPFGSTSCNAAYPFDTDNLAPGIRAWEVSSHSVGSATGVAKTEFSPAVLSPGELSSLTLLCQFITGNGSGAGICNSCTLGGQ